MNAENKITLVANIDDSQVDTATKKVERLVELIKEAKSLIDELTSSNMEIDLKINV